MPETRDPRLQIEQGFLSYTDSTINGSLILTTGSVKFPDGTSQTTAGGGGTGTPGGSPGQIQYNNGGSFGGVPTLTFNGTSLSATGSFTGSFTGSLQGTASFAATASRSTSASFATTAATVNGSVTITGGTIIELSGGDGSSAENTTQTLRVKGGGLGVTGNSYFENALGVGQTITASIVSATNNGNGTNFRVGDDVWIGDVNTADTMQVRGQQTATKGYIKFGSGSSNPILGSGGTSTLQLTGSLNVTGNVTIPSRHAFSVYGAGTTNNLTTTQNSTGTLNSNNFAVSYTQGTGFASDTGIFTAPIAGLYQVTLVGRNSGYSEGISQLAVVKNNSNAAGNVLMIEWAASSTMNHAGGAMIFQLAVNDTLRLKVLAGEINFDGNDNWSVAYIG